MSILRSRKQIAAILAAIVSAGLVLFLVTRPKAPTTEGMLGGASEAQSTGKNRRTASGASPTQWLRSAHDHLRRKISRDEGEAALKELASTIAGLPAAEASAALREFLGTGDDAPTGLGFKPGTDGSLTEAPTLRVFLLDELARIDPAAAAELAREILREKTSPDEWAVAMRNLAHAQNDEATRSLLEGKMRELLTYEPWQRDVAIGYLEAFDVAVYLRGANLVPELCALVRRTDERALAHAAFLALDRLAIVDPAPLLAKLADEPTLMQGREVTRAQFMARADVADAVQRAVLERFLIDPVRSAEDLKSFAGIFPNANFMVSENLLTPVMTPDRAALLARDQAALRVVNEWLADARFAGMREPLEQIRARLEKFARQANGQ